LVSLQLRRYLVTEPVAFRGAGLVVQDGGAANCFVFRLSKRALPDRCRHVRAGDS
jgi:hypothetical protein